LRIEDHTADLFAIAAYFKIGKFVLGGWSRACRFRWKPITSSRKRIQALLLINGAPRTAVVHRVPIPGFEPLAVRLLSPGALLGPTA
jgi:hypothetical protein